MHPVWNTTAGTLGSFPTTIPLTIQISATPEAPATTLTYAVLSGVLPSGINMTQTGLIYGTPNITTSSEPIVFTIRATDNLGYIRDRSFSMTLLGVTTPQFITPAGSLLHTEDSVWVELQLQYSNPSPTNNVTVSLASGNLPPGLEISETGLIRGYPNIPTVGTTLSSIESISTESASETNEITCVSTNGFSVGRPVVFSGEASFGDIVLGTTYYIKSIVDTSTFTISATLSGPTFNLVAGAGTLVTTLPLTSASGPAVRTYTFSLQITSELGGNIVSFSITVVNQNLPTSQGGPGKIPNTRIPVIFNTRPPTIEISPEDPYYSYYSDTLVDPLDTAFITTVQSGNYFSYKIIGNDFDSAPLSYSYTGLPLGLSGDATTGWITGVPVISTGINSYAFSVSVSKASRPEIASTNTKFSFKVSNGINDTIYWNTSTNLGTLLNGALSTLSVSAISAVPLRYRIVGGALPPHLTLLSNGEITGYVAHQPTSVLLHKGDTSVFNFTVEAYSPAYSIITSTNSFSVTVLQEYTQPTDTVYIKATPSIHDRTIIKSLLTDETLIPTSSLYRPADGYFGKATSVIYDHAFGIYSSDIEAYLAAVQTNHYWRNITLGELKTAVARNDAGEIIYEVVYSQIIDNLTNTKSVSPTTDSDSVYWPTPIDLHLGPWYTSITDIHASYDFNLAYHASLTPGYAQVLYPNSLTNMRNKLSQHIGQEYASKLLPQWMISQQRDGSTLGYTQAWVICYTVPNKSAEIKNNIETKWPYTLNQINFEIDRFAVNKSRTFNYDTDLTPPAWTGLPSASLADADSDSNDFYVLFPRKTILPDTTQY